MIDRVRVAAAATILCASIGICACGKSFDDGLAAFSRRDYATALRIWEPLAVEGNADAQFHLGLMYADGDGVEKDDTEAVWWYEKAAKQGHIPAQVNLGLMYHDGTGVEADYATAADWFRRAADGGDRTAQYSLGQMYLTGKGVIAL